MDVNSAVNSFVPLWIFVPLLLVGVVGLFTTPKAKRQLDSASASLDRSRPNLPQAQGTARPAFAR